MHQCTYKDKIVELMNYALREHEPPSEGLFLKFLTDGESPF